MSNHHGKRKKRLGRASVMTRNALDTYRMDESFHPVGDYPLGDYDSETGEFDFERCFRGEFDQSEVRLSDSDYRSLYIERRLAEESDTDELVELAQRCEG